MKIRLWEDVVNMTFQPSLCNPRLPYAPNKTLTTRLHSCYLGRTGAPAAQNGDHIKYPRNCHENPHC